MSSNQIQMINTFDQFHKSLQNNNVPVTNDYLKSLWYIAKDDWSMAHLIARDLDDPIGYWIHGYLHRVKGDDMNASYWYEKASKPYPNYSIQLELTLILRKLLQ